MPPAFVPQLVETLRSHGFREVNTQPGVIPDVERLLKRQTWNTNRAVVVVCPMTVPPDFSAYLKEVRKAVAFRCRFFPVLWGIGIQVVVAAAGVAKADIDPARHVAKFDNQWAIVQSLFLVDPEAGSYASARSPGQFVTGKYQDAIESVLADHFSPPAACR